MSSKTVIENTLESEFEHAKELAIVFSPQKRQKAGDAEKQIAVADKTGCITEPDLKKAALC